MSDPRKYPFEASEIVRSFEFSGRNDRILCQSISSIESLCRSGPNATAFAGDAYLGLAGLHPDPDIQAELIQNASGKWREAIFPWKPQKYFDKFVGHSLVQLSFAPIYRSVILDKTIPGTPIQAKTYHDLVYAGLEYQDFLRTSSGRDQQEDTKQRLRGGLAEIEVLLLLLRDAIMGQPVDAKPKEVALPALLSEDVTCTYHQDDSPSESWDISCLGALSNGYLDIKTKIQVKAKEKGKSYSRDIIVINPREDLITRGGLPLRSGTITRECQLELEEPNSENLTNALNERSAKLREKIEAAKEQQQENVVTLENALASLAMQYSR